MNPTLSLVKCETYDMQEVSGALRRALNLLGGIKAFIRPNSKVLVKPNLLMAIGPESGVVTHPAVVRATVRLLKDIGCKIIIGDGPSVWGRVAENIDEVYEKTGIKKLAQEEGVELTVFDKRRWREKFPLAALLDECEAVVSIPKFKTHDLTLLTGAIKNLYGLIPGTYKTELHKKHYYNRDFSSALVDLYEEVRPALTIVDGVVAIEGDGPATGGSIIETKLLVAGRDCVAIDSVLALIMGISPRSVLSTKIAAERRLGCADMSSINIAGDKPEDIIIRPFRLPSTSFKKKLPPPVVELAKRLIRFYPQVDREKCNLCHACVEACPVKVISEKNKRISINYSGCISCFCCQEACPASAISVKKSFFAKIVGL